MNVWAWRAGNLGGTVLAMAAIRDGSNSLAVALVAFTLLWIAVMPIKHGAASGMEARRAAAENTDAVHDSPVPSGRRPNPIGDIPQDV